MNKEWRACTLALSTCNDRFTNGGLDLPVTPPSFRSARDPLTHSNNLGGSADRDSEVRNVIFHQRVRADDRVPPDLDAVKHGDAGTLVSLQSVGLSGVRDKAGFLAACALDLGFPAHFGGNWDALADSIDELEAEAGSGIVIEFMHVHEFARDAADDAATALAILRDTAAAWRARKRSFIALFGEAPRGETLATFALPGA